MAHEEQKQNRSVRQRFELNGRNYIVTGGGQGIGFAVAEAICEMGGNVGVLDLRQTPVDEFHTLAKRFGVKTAYARTDVSSAERLQAGFDQVMQTLGTLDGIFTAAGIAIDKPFVDQTPDEFMNIQKVNVFGSFYAAQLAVKQMQKQKTKGSRMASYNASKGGVFMLSKALATELAPFGIRCNTISPAFTDTAQTQVVRNADPTNAGVMWSQPPLGRIGEADEMTAAVIYLLSDASSYTTGADIAITGGIHVGRKTDYAMHINGAPSS
ncbi:hypothetical protein LTR70_006634 [Exophiala xenobiotica]|nr:hypothetical protein LTR70_006634 [Exophiala xenobiotica]